MGASAICSNLKSQSKINEFQVLNNINSSQEKQDTEKFINVDSNKQQINKQNHSSDVKLKFCTNKKNYLPIFHSDNDMVVIFENESVDLKMKTCSTNNKTQDSQIGYKGRLKTNKKQRTTKIIINESKELN